VRETEHVIVASTMFVIPREDHAMAEREEIGTALGGVVSVMMPT